MKREMKRNFGKHLLLSSGVVLAAIAIASAALYYLSNDLDAQATKIISDKTLVAQQSAVVSVLASLKSDAVQAAQYAAAMAKLLPSHDELIGFPQWVNALGEKHEVSVSVVFQGNNTAVTASSPGSDGFSLNATGAAGNLVDFLSDLETQAPGFLLAIDSVDLTSGGSGYQLSLRGRVFSR